MGAKRGKEYERLPYNTFVEVVAINGETVVKKKMQFDEALRLKKKPGWRYINYQIGFCSIQESK